MTRTIEVDNGTFTIIETSDSSISLEDCVRSMIKCIIEQSSSPEDQ